MTPVAAAQPVHRLHYDDGMQFTVKVPEHPVKSYIGGRNPGERREKSAGRHSQPVVTTPPPPARSSQDAANRAAAAIRARRAAQAKRDQTLSRLRTAKEKLASTQRNIEVATAATKLLAQQEENRESLGARLAAESEQEVEDLMLEKGAKEADKLAKKYGRLPSFAKNLPGPFGVAVRVMLVLDPEEARAPTTGRLSGRIGKEELAKALKKTKELALPQRAAKVRALEERLRQDDAALALADAEYKSAMANMSEALDGTATRTPPPPPPPPRPRTTPRRKAPGNARAIDRAADRY